MAELVVKTRVTPKRLSEQIVSRERLVRLLESNLGRNMILITAPAGYGKTTLVLDFLSRLNKTFAWLYIAPDINNLYSFINYLIHSLRTLKDDFGQRTLELLESLSESGSVAKDEKGTITALSGTFVNEFINTFDNDVYLVIDDLQNAGSSGWLINIFNSLIEDFPPNLHIIITSRSIPEFNIARLGAKRNLLKIDSSELHFNYDETEKLINEIYSIKCGKNDITALENKMEGWITGLHLILQAYGEKFPSAMKGKNIIDDSLFDYFANEIFTSLDKSLQEFLLATSLTDSFTDEMCKTLTGSQDTYKIIELLKRKNIFIETTTENENTISYNYHNLFKQYLVKKLHEEKSPSEIKAIGAKIFGYYQGKNDNLRAIEFSIHSEQFDAAAELIIKEFDELFRSGRYELLDNWMSALPDEIISKNNYLKLIRAKLLYHYRSDLDPALTALEQLAENKDNEVFIQASIEYSDILLIKGKADEAVTLLENLIKTEQNPVNYTKISLELAKAYYSLGSDYYDRIISLLDETLKLNDENNLREYHSEIYSRYGRVYQSRGIFSKALHYFKNVVELEKNVYKKFQTMTDIVLLHSWTGEYQKAKEYLDKVNEIYSRFPIIVFKKEVLRITALLKYEAGDYEDAVNKFLELQSLDISLNIKSFFFLYNLFIAESYILLGKKERANEFIELAGSTKQSDDVFHDLMIDYHYAIIENLGNPGSKIERILLDAHKFFESRNLIYPKVQVEFHLADYYFKTGNNKTSIKYLEDSLGTSSEKQFSSFLLQHFISKRYLFDIAIASGIQKDYISSLLAELPEKENFTWLSGEAHTRINKEMFRLYDIAVNTFGGTEIYLRGIPVPEDKWIRKKSKLLLIYLLIYRELKHTKEKILELFFSELSSASADNVFHQAVTNLRNAVNPVPQTNADVKKNGKRPAQDKKEQTGQNISFITYEDKILSITQGFLYKVDADEFSKLHSRIKSQQTENAEKLTIAKKAVDLYKGEFLPGYYEDWIEELRSNLQNKFIEICEEILPILEKEKNYSDIIFFAERLISADKLHETGYVSIIRAYSQSGNTNMAKKKFSQLLKNYDEEYGEKPSKEILKQIEEILLESE